MLSNGLVLMGVPDAVQLIVKGVVLALAVFVSLERGKIGVIK
jgi:ABC-type xylose transport system permease subunit